MIEASDPSLNRGFHLLEEDNGFHWTDGDGMIPATLFDRVDGDCELEMNIACTTQYPLFGNQTREASAIDAAR